MLETWRYQIGRWYSGVHFRAGQDHPLRFNDVVARARRALVIFPEETIDRETTQTLLKYLSRRFAAGSMVVLVRKELLPSITSMSGMRTIAYTPDDINSWFIPRQSLLRKLKSSTFDIAIDLNIGLALPSAYVCREINAPLRVGFVKEFADRFYNLQVQVKANGNGSSAYRNLLRCLDMF